MDAPNLSINTAAAKVIQGVQIGILKKTLEQMEQTGVQLAEMMSEMEVPADSIIDIKV